MSKSIYLLFAVVAIGTAGCKVGIRKVQPFKSSGSVTLVPAIISVVPPNSATSGGEQITITGQGFSNGATVTIGGVACTSTLFVSSTELQCNVPAHAVGSLPLIVTDPDQQVASATFLYFVAAQNAPNFTTNLGGGPSVGHAGGLGVSAVSSIGEAVQAQPQSAVGVSVKSGIVSVTTP